MEPSSASEGSQTKGKQDGGVPKDFGKPNMEKFGARSQTWQPSLSSLRLEGNAEQHRILAQLEISDAEALQSGNATS